MRYTALCIECPPGQQRKPERDSASHAASDLDCGHRGQVLEIWSTHIEARENEDGDLVDVEVRSVVEVPL